MGRIKLSGSVSIFFSLIFFSINLFAAESAVGKFTLIKGSVYLLKNGTEKVSAKLGDSVSESDSVESAAGGIARITMIDSNLIDVYPKTKISIAKYIYKSSEDLKNVELNVSFGKIKSTVNQKYDGSKNTYQVKTPTVVAGVRGTIFTTGYDPVSKLSEVITLRGLVAVARIERNNNMAPPVFVKPNQRIEINPKSIREEPKEIPAEERKQIDQNDAQMGITSAENRPANLDQPIADLENKQKQSDDDETKKRKQRNEEQIKKQKNLEERQARRQKQLEEQQQRRIEDVQRLQEEEAQRVSEETAKRLLEQIKTPTTTIIDGTTGGNTGGGGL